MIFFSAKSSAQRNAYMSLVKPGDAADLPVLGSFVEAFLHLLCSNM
jgi:hypothetical protein